MGSLAVQNVLFLNLHKLKAQMLVNAIFNEGFLPFGLIWFLNDHDLQTESAF